MSLNHKSYSATLAQFKATIRHNPTAVTFIDLEEAFFTIDDTMTSFKRESANYIVGGGNNSKKDIKCYNCGKLGHYKSECRSSSTTNNNKQRGNASTNSNSQSNSNASSNSNSNVTCNYCKKPGHFVSGLGPN